MSYNNLSSVATIEIIRYALNLHKEVSESPFKLAVALTPWDADEFVREERSVNVGALFVVRTSENAQVYSWNIHDAVQYAATKAHQGKEVAILALQEVTNFTTEYYRLRSELQVHDLLHLENHVCRDLGFGYSDDWTGFGNEALFWAAIDEMNALRDESWWMAARNEDGFAIQGMPWGACNTLVVKFKTKGLDFDGDVVTLL